MDLRKYFRMKQGTGYLATADHEGRVNVAVYARPHVMDDGTLAFGTTDRLTHANLLSNPRAVYAFNTGGFRGHRIYLEKTGEESSGDLLEEIRARADEIVRPGAGQALKYVVYFKVTNILPLVGT